MKTQKNKAITLVALVITMIVLIILAAVSLNVLFGENGIITKAKLGKNKFLGEDAREYIERSVAAYKQDAAQKGVDTTLYDFWFMYNGNLDSDYFTDDMAIYLFEDTISAKFKPATKNNTRPENSIANADAGYSPNNPYKTAIVVYNDYVTAVDENVIVSVNVMEIDKNGEVQTFLESAEANQGGTMNANLKQAAIDERLNITTSTINQVGETDVGGGGTIEDALPTGEAPTNPIKNGGISANSSEDTSAVASNLDSITFDSSYAKVDVIWIKRSGNTDVVTSNPYMPTVPTGFAEEKFNSDTTVSYYTTSNSGNTDGKDCKWFNIKSSTVSDGSLFVWIPRYAYRITYYSNSSRTTPTGYYDGYGLYKADGTQKMKLESGVRTIDYNGAKYIIHPVFTACVDMGGWDAEIPGFWFGKYEVSGSIDALQTVSGVSPLRGIIIGDMFTAAKGYNATLNSHMVKNSEWGAVALLTESKYGRNGNEVSMHYDSNYTTGFNGANFSTTGNQYGIYDMNGCASECVATYQKNQATNSYGQSLVNEGKANGYNYNTPATLSTKYVTAYTLTNNNYGNDMFTVCKTGDSIKESSAGTGSQYGLHSDYAKFAQTSYPFFRRGGYYNDGSYAGVFSSVVGSGNSGSNIRFSSSSCGKLKYKKTLSL